jgi:protocatechuate 3,4-dioxygenase beta subunit
MVLSKLVKWSVLAMMSVSTLAGVANAASPVQDRSAGFCDITPSVKFKGMPASDDIWKSNKLSKPAGKSQYVKGRLLFLTGHVYDANCHPLRGAKVEIWHADDNGKYVSPDEADFANPQPLFAGSGSTLTNNEGEYGFETIMPASVKGAAPRINFRIQHPKIKPVTTVMYVGEHGVDKATKKMSLVSRELLNAKVTETTAKDGNPALRVIFDITVKGKDPYAKF